MSGTDQPMDSELWKRVEPLLDEALELAPEERTRFIEGIEDPELRNEVRSLAALDAAEHGPLDQSPSLVATLGAPAEAPRELGPYRLLRRIGEGGMGVVWEALDTRLDRHIALKVIADQDAGDSALARFEREARSLARLNHPNIVTIHSVETIDGVPLLTMELVDGQQLDRCIPESGLSPEQALEYSISLADALATAHRLGIIHRDLKPNNVMVTREGLLKVLDFGLAKLEDTVATQKTTEYRTAQGTILGTVPYMSPEQLDGKAVDYRSDQFSLGCVIYEIFAGRRAFAGRSSGEILTAILHRQPPSLTSIRRDLPPGVGQLVEQCLEKSADRRFASTDDLVSQLQEVQRRWLASDWSAVSSAMLTLRRYARRHAKRAAILAALALVAALVLILEPWKRGSATTDSPGSSPAVAVSIDSLAADDDPDNRSEIPGAQFAYRRGLAAAAEATDQRRWLRAIDSFEQAVELDPDFGAAWAQIAIYRAMAISNATLREGESRESSWKAAGEALARAQELAPQASWTRLAGGYMEYYRHRDHEKAHEIFAAELARRPGNVDAHRAMGAIERRRGNLGETLRHWRIVIDRYPNEVHLIVGMARTHMARREDAQAAALLDRVLEIEPDEPTVYFYRAWAEIRSTGSVQRTREFLEQLPRSDAALFELARFERDWPRYRAALAEIEPPAEHNDLGLWYVLVGFAERQLGNEAAAAQFFEQALSHSEVLFTRGRGDRATVIRGLALAYLGRKEEALRIVSGLPLSYNQNDQWTGPRIGETHAEILTAAGYIEHAVRQLQRVFESEYIDALSAWQLRLDPIWDPLRGDPDFERLIAAHMRDADVP